MKLGIIDIGIGNLKSIQNMFERIGFHADFIRNIDDLKVCDKIVLPGMGSFDKCMIALNDSGLKEELERHVKRLKKPFLGICVGLQMLMRKSDEGNEPGLAWINGDTVAFAKERLNATQKIPNMGWLDVELINETPLNKELHGSRFYFAHSYHIKLDSQQDEWIRAIYGYPFTAAVRRENIFGVQFHPEKSHKFGMQLLKNFAELA